MGDTRKRYSCGGATGLAVLNSLPHHNCQSVVQSMWAERSGRISRSSLGSIYGSPAHRSVPAPTTSRFAPLRLHLIFPRSPLVWLFDPLRSRSASRPDLRGGGGQGPRFPHQPGPSLWFFFPAGRYMRGSYFPIRVLIIIWLYTIRHFLIK